LVVCLPVEEEGKREKRGIVTGGVKGAVGGAILGAILPGVSMGQGEPGFF
jgi:hypothetical protein